LHRANVRYKIATNLAIWWTSGRSRSLGRSRTLKLRAPSYRVMLDPHSPAPKKAAIGTELDVNQRRARLQKLVTLAGLQFSKILNHLI